MDCKVIKPDLIRYHFGVIEDDARGDVEKHLTECSDCLRDFIALKREMETSDAKPSPAAKDRLRQAVALEIRRPLVTWSWWERPLAAAFASAAVALAIFMVQTLASSQGAAPHGLVTQGVSHHL